jgi:hypothetical protein
MILKNLNAISFSSFNKYKKKEFKNFFQQTGVCEYCYNRKLIQKKIEILSKDLEINNKNLEDSKQLLTYFRSFKDKIQKIADLELNLENNEETKNLQIKYDHDISKCSTIINSLEHKISLDFHRDIYKRQRSTYNKFRKDKNFLKNNLLIDFDYKEKLSVGHGPLSESFYKQRSISYLSFGVYFVQTIIDKENNSNEEIICNNYDILSDNLHQDGNAVVRALRFIREQDSFKIIDKKNYTIISDCGSHFRNKEIVHYFFSELAELIEPILASFNFFAPLLQNMVNLKEISIFLS